VSLPSAIIPHARLNVGRLEVSFLSDGFIDFPFALFTGAAPEQVEQAAAAHFAARRTGIRSGFTVWLIRDGERLVLVDTGPAGTVSKTSGHLPKALAAIGISPASVDAVIITHMHVDHIAGLVVGGLNRMRKRWLAASIGRMLEVRKSLFHGAE
jgi:hypothetical protein